MGNVMMAMLLGYRNWKRRREKEGGTFSHYHYVVIPCISKVESLGKIKVLNINIGTQQLETDNLEETLADTGSPKVKTKREIQRWYRTKYICNII